MKEEKKESSSFILFPFFQVGGKNINEGMIDLVEGFVRDLVSKADELGYTRHVVLFDQNYKPEK